VKTKPILVRLQNALDQQDLLDQILLVPEPRGSAHVATNQTHDTVNLVVGYTGSPNSQTALDLALWIAHQTRVASQKQVTVHVVHVVDRVSAISHLEDCHSRSRNKSRKARAIATCNAQASTASSMVATQSRHNRALSSKQLEHVDQILWKARCLADEWRGSLSTHLRFGDVADELHQVAVTEEADLLFLGCQSRHPLVQQLAVNFPCPILGIPSF
jgi:nucleotide-binding universal stress UspA family protein